MKQWRFFFLVGFFLSCLLLPAAAQVQFGTNDSMWANDGECDDPRFEGPGMAAGQLSNKNIGGDASDCRLAWQSSTVWLRGTRGTSVRPVPRPRPDTAQGQRNGSDDRLISRVQIGLAELGYYDGEIDGRLTTETRRAIRAFQVSVDLEPTGIPNNELYLLIGIALGVGFDDGGPAPPIQNARSSGSGFYISGIGHIVSNEHVISDCRKIRSGAGQTLQLIASDEPSDLALLRDPKISIVSDFLSIRTGDAVRLAEPVVVAGFPLTGLLDNGVNVTVGNTTALSGPGQDARLFQISAPVQPGNSGGPVVDNSGRLVGVVVSKLNAVRVAEETGDIPQNINFAISLQALVPFLDRHSVSYETMAQGLDLGQEGAAELATQATIQIFCE